MSFLDDVLKGLPSSPVPLRQLPDDTELPIRVGGFELQRRLGGGGFGAVYLARHIETQSDWAVKLLGSRSNPEAEQNELSGLRQVFGRLDEHANLLRCQLPERDEKHGVFYAMDLADAAVAGAARYDPATLAGELSARRWPGTYQEFLGLAQALCDGAAFMHSRRVAHCDIKPANIVKKGGWRLADFGLATKVEDGRPRGYTGRYSPAAGSAASDSLERFDLACIGATLFESALSDDAWRRLRPGLSGVADQAFQAELDSSPRGRQIELLRFGRDSGHALALIKRLRGDSTDAIATAEAGRDWVKGERRSVERRSMLRPLLTAAVLTIAVVAVVAGMLVPVADPTPEPISTSVAFTAVVTAQRGPAGRTADSITFSERTGESSMPTSGMEVTTAQELNVLLKPEARPYVMLLAVGPDGIVEPIRPADASERPARIEKVGQDNQLLPHGERYALSPGGWHALILIVSDAPLRALSEWRDSIPTVGSPGDGLSNLCHVYFFDGESARPIETGERGRQLMAARQNRITELCDLAAKLTPEPSAASQAAQASIVRALVFNSYDAPASSAGGALKTLPPEERP